MKNPTCTLSSHLLPLPPPLIAHHLLFASSPDQHTYLHCCHASINDNSQTFISTLLNFSSVTLKHKYHQSSLQVTQMCMNHSRKEEEEEEEDLLLQHSSHPPQRCTLYLHHSQTFGAAKQKKPSIILNPFILMATRQATLTSPSPIPPPSLPHPAPPPPPTPLPLPLPTLQNKTKLAH